MRIFFQTNLTWVLAMLFTKIVNFFQKGRISITSNQIHIEFLFDQS